MDTLTKRQRSARMALVRASDTKPEQIVRHLISGMGYRYRLHDRKLPGSPDLVFSSRKVIFVHGCFWHRHKCRNGQRLPKSKLDFWLPKLEKNRKRDARNLRKLKGLGWRSLVIWECQLRDLAKLSAWVNKFILQGDR